MRDISVFTSAGLFCSWIRSSLLSVNNCSIQKQITGNVIKSLSCLDHYRVQVTQSTFSLSSCTNTVSSEWSTPSPQCLPVFTYTCNSHSKRIWYRQGIHYFVGVALKVDMFLQLLYCKNGNPQIKNSSCSWLWYIHLPLYRSHAAQ